ncbi:MULTISPECIES: non-ribosomal peptide synthetase [Nostoc]|uniref:Amino acid adenylation domain-containing protein n=2 Tax=Nostoc TaxID=1177 RepID=A0ABR8I2U4_9NOSO|nr:MULTISPECIES: non-ribosomal peptide synthetase [Nostoc]MBD2559799.1 amino acid adenylation domain-containing protein [Nostoc linckia FACHB-391]MBD2645237.1 amino acid adenylation domain-containing protein [Nostoc foliaceum FACHB-393]
MQQEIIEGYRLSPQQRHLWSLQQLDSALPYRAQFSLLIEGNLNQKILEVALEKLVNRHEILRTNFCYLPGMTIPLQVIADNSKLSVHYSDFSNLYSQQQDARIAALFDEVFRLPFNFEKKPIFDVYLITLSINQHILLISLPSLCADTATIFKLAEEISDLYAVCCQDEELTDEPTQYADIAQWQNEIIEADDTKTGVEYWQLINIENIYNTQLPFENKITHKFRFEPQSFTLSIHPDLVDKIAALAQKYETSTSTFLLACWQILLWRITGESKIIVGQAFDGRKYEELEEAIGLVGKYLPIACVIEDNLQINEVINQASKLVNDAYKWQEYFDWEQLKFTKKSIESAFLPFSFEFLEYPEKYSNSGITFSLLKQYVCFDKFKVKLSCICRDDYLTLDFNYDSSLFNAKVIERLASQFQTLLQSVINEPEVAIGKLEILNHIERQQLLIEFNQTKTDYSPDKCIHYLFEQQADLTPDKIAVVFEDQQITYAELNTKANQLAHYLQQLGVRPDVLVGLFAERSLELIIGILGILKAGGAYLPLDPTLPKEGLNLRLQNTQAPILLTQQHLVETLPDYAGKIVTLDTGWHNIVQESHENPTSEVGLDNLIYVLFTSGSTGKPKGVAVEHQQLFNYINAIKDRLELSGCNTFATITTFAADLGNTTIFPSLCSGGCLHIVSSERASNPEALADYFHRHPIDCLKIVPSHLAALLASSQAQKILPKQRLILGGEACSWDLIEQIQQLKPECLIFNHYGPTEATVGVLTYPVKLGQTDYRSKTVPIGRPIANAQVYLLDSYLQPVPIGVPGELYISGTGIARGYLNEPDLTSEKFISHSFDEVGGKGAEENFPATRLYKTGDLARYLPDGNIEFLGRIDHQVKIHGYRIELGEIEAALRQHPAVRETVVLVRDESGNKRLVAYVVPEKQSAPKTAELRAFLSEKLPEYMIPSAFVRLKALPLLPNGKLDRQALPAPDMSRSDLEGSFVAPSTAFEKVLAEIWAKILRLEQVGIHDNFFELGGDSILSMQIIAKANQAGLQITPKHLFKHQTIAELAAVALKNRIIPAEQGLVTGQVPLTPIQHWFFEQNLLDSHHWNQSILLEVHQSLDPALLEQVVKQLLAHHDALRLRFVRQESTWQQVNANLDEVVPFTVVDLSRLSQTEQAAAISVTAAQLQASLDLSSGPLMQVAFFNLGDTKPSRLLMTIHHLAVDGVSWRILLSDLETAYQHISQGKAIQLPPKTTSFKHWAEKLQEYAESTVLQQELEYWLAIAAEQFAQIPVDFPEGDNTVAQAHTISVALSQQETQALLQKVPAIYQTQINDVLLTALVQGFKPWTNERLLVDLEGHGREEIFEDVDLLRTVGWFTTIFPVVLDVSKTSGVGEAVKAVKEQLRSIPNRGIGYGVLRYLKGESRLHQLKANVRFNYLGQTDQVFESSMFAPASESTEPGRSLRGNRNYLLDINGIVADGQLQLSLTYSKAIHRQATIEILAQDYIAALRELIAHCETFTDYKSFDLPEAKLSPKEKAEVSNDVAFLNAEAVLDPTIYPQTSFEYTAEPSHIFLTGATGFVGAFLLYELLQQTSADIYCLVRSANAELGKKKLQSHLESYKVWDETLSDRIIPVVGDLSQPLLGLSNDKFQVMASKIDVIYHNAASINLVHSYSSLKAANVLGTQEILRLACEIKVKPVHYISTLSVLTSESHGEVKQISELHKFNDGQAPFGGYAQTKWVAEKLVTTAYQRGIPVSIYRLGRISGHSKTGVCNTNDRLYRMIKGFIQLGYVPDVDTIVDMTPVDYVSQAIVHLSKQKKSLNQIFHLSNHHPARSFQLFNFIREFGYPLQLMSNNQWQTELLNAAERSLDNPLYPLIPFFASNENAKEKEELTEDLNSPSLKFDCQNTTDGLADSSIICPPADAELLSTYFSYLIHTGFMNAPQIKDLSS